MILNSSSQDQSGPGSNNNEGVFHIPQSIRTGTLLTEDI